MFGRGLIALGLVCVVFASSNAHAQAPLTFEQALTMARVRRGSRSPERALTKRVAESSGHRC